MGIPMAPLKIVVNVSGRAHAGDAIRCRYSARRQTPSNKNGTRYQVWVSTDPEHVYAAWRGFPRVRREREEVDEGNLEEIWMHCTLRRVVRTMMTQTAHYFGDGTREQKHGTVYS